MDYRFIFLITFAVVVGSVLFLAYYSPRRFVRLLFRPLLGLLYRAEIDGLENFPRSGPVIVACNHVSWLDGILILWMLPRNVRFLVDGENFQSPIMNYLGRAFDTIYLQGNVKSIATALRTGREALGAGEVVGIFPEGTITRTGQLQGFRPGMQKLLQGNPETRIVPCYLQGMWGSIFSFSGGVLLRKKPEMPRRLLRLKIGRPLEATASLDQVREQIQQLGARAMSEQVNHELIPPRRLLRSLKRRGKRMKVADLTGEQVSGRTLLIRALVARRLLRRLLDRDEKTVGILLPPSVGGVIANIAVALDGRSSANLNYTATATVNNECMQVAGIRHVLTSRRFLSKIDLQMDAPWVYLEDLPAMVTRQDKLIGAAQAFLPSWILERMLGLTKLKANDLLTVIFTSGSTGTPKGVMLSHGSITHNVNMVDQAVRLNGDDVVVGILPFFHSFGYAITLWGVLCLEPAGVYHFSPLDARQIGKIAREHRATVLLATPTFLRGYMRRVEPEDFKTLNVVVVGAEKMPADLFEAFEKRFGCRPVEGYGMTEMGPLVSVNIPPSRSLAKFQPDRREGSVGRPLVGVACRVVNDQGAELPPDTEGLLEVRGPNLMLGYMRQEDLTAKAIRDGWYQTGDLAKIDGDGFLHITGRQSRFSKIGGEMVPHGRIEEVINAALREGDDDDQLRAVVTSVPDERKGESLIVLHLKSDKTPEQLRSSLTAAGLPNLYLPAVDSFFVVDAIPLLGTGKLDLKGIRDLATKLTTTRQQRKQADSPPSDTAIT